jgi:hypothetical protein
MCTVINKLATDNFRKDTPKGKKVIAYKVVLVRYREWLPPLHSYHFGTYNKTILNTVPTASSCMDRGALHDGAFHLCRTRKIAELFLGWIRSKRIGPKYSIKKVAFDIKDLVAVGGLLVSDQIDMGIKGNDTQLAVRSFKFVKQAKRKVAKCTSEK